MCLPQVLSLIEENTAAALHYGIDRVFEEPNTVVYYNMGASAVQVRRALSAPYLGRRYLSLPVPSSLSPCRCAEPYLLPI